METKSKPLPTGIINPFSPEFLDKWNLWKDFRWQEHKFKYKGCISEQAALMRLTTVALGKEETAVEIIMQSIAMKWKDFYMIKEKNNGHSKAPTREDINTEFASRSYANGKH